MNTGANRVSCGGKVIFPSHAVQLPDSARAEAIANPNLIIAGEEESSTVQHEAARNAEKSLAEILKHNVPDVLERAEELPLDELRRLLDIEASEKKTLMGLRGGPRKQVIEGLETLIELREEEDAEAQK